MNPIAQITALIVNHNGARTVARAIESVRQQGDLVREIIVVDNASGDGSREQIRETFPEVRVISLGKNPGPGYARNVGLEHARTELLLWLDDDIYLAPDSLARMTASLHETGATAVCPRILFLPEKETIQCDGAGIHFCGVLALRNSRAPANLEPDRAFVNAAGGGCLLVRRAELAGLGGFDEDYFFYFEDLEISYRLRSHAHLICCEPAAIAYHDAGAGEPALAFRGEGTYPARRAGYLLLHRWMIVWTHYGLRSLIVLWPALLLYEAASLAEAARRGWLLQWAGAFLRLIRVAPRLAGKRSDSQRRRRVPDRDLLEGGPLPFSHGFIRSRLARALAALLDRALNGYWVLVRARL